MSLSQRAQDYIAKMQRNQDWQTAASETRSYLNSFDLIATESLIHFQELYSGLTLTIRNKPKSTFEALLFSKNQIATLSDPEPIVLKDTSLFHCGQHATAQFNFFLSSDGAFCTLGDDDKPNILKTSFEKHVEEYALRNEISEWEFAPPYYQVKNFNELSEYMGHHYEIIPECSDDYCTWWGNETTKIVKGVWLDREEDHDFYVHVYGINRSITDHLVDKLSSLGVI